MSTVPASGRPWGVASSTVLTMVEDYLRDEALRTHQRLGDVVGVALTTAVAGGEPLTTGASTVRVAEVDSVQYSLGDGPCLQALRGGDELYVPDLAQDARWGRYGPEAAALGARCCLSVPVSDEDGVLGVAKVYAGGVDGLDAEQQQTVRDFALAVAGGLGLASHLITTSVELDDRTEAMDQRRTIDLATGLLMGRLGCGPDEAFDVLRHESQNHNLKLRDVAADLLAQASGAAGDDEVPQGTPTATVLRAPFSRRGESPV